MILLDLCKKYLLSTVFQVGFSGDSVIKNPPANAGDAGWIPGSERSPGEGNGSPLQHSCLENSMGRGACYSPWDRKESYTTEQLNNNNNCVPGTVWAPGIHQGTWKRQSFLPLRSFACLACAGSSEEACGMNQGKGSRC